MSGYLFDASYDIDWAIEPYRVHRHTDQAAIFGLERHRVFACVVDRGKASGATSNEP